jgi:hypothetical protein
VGGIPHSAASDGTTQVGGDAEPAPPLGLPAWTWGLLGLLLGLGATLAGLLLERHTLETKAQLHLSLIAKRSVSQIERQFETTGLLLRAVQSAYFVEDSIDQARFQGIHDNLAPHEMLPSLVALAFARHEVSLISLNWSRSM